MPSQGSPRDDTIAVIMEVVENKDFHWLAAEIAMRYMHVFIFKYI